MMELQTEGDASLALEGESHANDVPAPLWQDKLP